MGTIPEYTGLPLGLFSKVTAPESDFALWTWGATTSALPNTSETIEQLVGNNYQQVPRTPGSFLMLYLFSQLCDVLIVGEESPQLWARSNDIEYVKQHPVILAFPLDQELQENKIPMLQFLPAPNIGEYALIGCNQGELEFYNVAQLPAAIQEQWKLLNLAIRELAAPGEWIPHSTHHQYCSDELYYQRLVTDYRSAIFKSQKEERDQAKTFLAQLERAHQQVTALRQSWLKPDWFISWEGIKRMARDLAQDYYTYHQYTKNAGERPIPDIADVFNMGVASVFTAQPFQAFPAAAISRKGPAKEGGEWRQEEAEKENELIISYERKKDSGTTVVQIREEVNGQERDAVLARMWGQSRKLSDLDSDVYLAKIAQLLAGNKDPEGNTWITAQQILNYRSLAPKRNKDDPDDRYTGGHRWEKVEEIGACMARQDNIYIKINELEIIDDSKPVNSTTRRRPRTTISRESRLFMPGDIIYHNTLPLDGSPSKAIPIAWQYRESSWMLPFLQGSNRFTGILLKKVLNYDPYHEMWEKRLSKHFFFWLRTNASKPQKPKLYVGELLRELNLDIEEERPQRTRDRFEKAMNQIEADGMLIWDYKDSIELPARKWLQTWLQQQIIVEDPPYVKSQYMGIAAAAQAIRSQQKVTRPAKPKKIQSRAKKNQAK